MYENKSSANKPDYFAPDRDKLTEMVDHVMKTSGCVVDMDALLNRLEPHFPGCDIGRLIFDPPSGKRMTAAEIVNEALGSVSVGDESR